MSDDYVCPTEFNEMLAMKKLYVAGLDRNTTDEELQEYFSTFGEVVDGVVIKRDNGKAKTFGFITFAQCDDVDECLLKRDSLNLNGCHLEVKRAVPKDDTSETAQLRTKQLFISNVTPSLTEEKIRDYLESRHPTRFGKIEKIILMKTRDQSTGKLTDKNRGFGFITLDSEDMADRIAIGDAVFNIGGMTRPQGIQKALPRDDPNAAPLPLPGRSRGRGERSGRSSGSGSGGGSGGSRGRDHGGDWDDYGYDSYSGGYDDRYRSYGGGYEDDYDDYYSDSRGRSGGGGGGGDGYGSSSGYSSRYSGPPQHSRGGRGSGGSSSYRGGGMSRGGSSRGRGGRGGRDESPGNDYRGSQRYSPY